MGGSTNTVLHTLAVAIEAGHTVSIGKHLNEVSARVPYLCKVAPSGNYHMEDVFRAGGISAILKTLAGKPGTLNLNCITVTGKTLGENIGDATVKDADVIRPLSNPYSQTGGLGRAVRQPRAQWQRAEDRGGTSEHAPIHRASSDFRKRRIRSRRCA